MKPTSKLPTSGLDLREDVATMTFALYGSCSPDPRIQRLSIKGDQAGRDLIQRLLNELDDWETTYRAAGASDTASRESIAINIARALGLRGYAD